MYTSELQLFLLFSLFALLLAVFGVQVTCTDMCIVYIMYVKEVSTHTSKHTNTSYKICIKIYKCIPNNYDPHSPSPSISSGESMRCRYMVKALRAACWKNRWLYRVDCICRTSRYMRRVDYRCVYT